MSVGFSPDAACVKVQIDCNIHRLHGFVNARSSVKSRSAPRLIFLTIRLLSWIILSLEFGRIELNHVSVRCCLYQSSIYNKLTTHMNRLRSRTWQIVAVLVILTFMGLSHPLAELIGAYKHRVATLGEYVRYKRNPSRFYDEYSAGAMSFDCERIRDDFVKLTQSIISPELSTSA